MSVAYSPKKSNLRFDLTNILELNSKRISPIKPYDLDKINFGKPLDTQPSRNQSKLYIMPMFQSKKQSSISTIRINNNRSQSLYKTNQMLSNNNATMWQDYYQSSKKIGVSQLTLEIQQLSAFEKQQAYNKLLLPKYGVKTLRNESINFLNSSNIEQENTIKQSEKIGLFQMNNNESKLDHLKDIASTQQNKYRSLTNNIKRQAAQNEEKLLNNIKAMRSIISPTNKKYFQTPNNFNDTQILSESKHIGSYQNFKRDDQTPEITQILSPTYIENVFSMTTVKNQRRFSNKKAFRQESIETMQISRETILPDINNSLKQHSMKIQDDNIYNLLMRQSTNKNDSRRLFDSQHEVKIYKSGQLNINEKSKCVRFDLNQLKKQFFVYKGEEEILKNTLIFYIIHESGKIIEIQSQFYEQALQELLEQCNETFLKQYDLKSSKPIIIYNFMFLPNGKQIKNILQIPEDQQYLICQKREKFHAIQFEEVTSLRQSKVIDMKNEIKQSINKLQRTIKNQLEDTNIVDQKNHEIKQLCASFVLNKNLQIINQTIITKVKRQ